MDEGEKKIILLEESGGEKSLESLLLLLDEKEKELDKKFKNNGTSEELGIIETERDELRQKISEIKEKLSETEIETEKKGASNLFLNFENLKIFNNISEEGKGNFNQLYEGLCEIPIIKRIVEKFKITHNQFWADKNEEKTIHLKEEIDVLNLEIETFDNTKKEIKSIIESLKQQNIPGAEHLLLDIKIIEQKKIQAINKKNKIQSKFEERENKIKLYTNKRDSIADDFIKHYNEKIQLMEKDLGELQIENDKLDLRIAITEVKHEEQIEKLNEIENKKNVLEETLRKIKTEEEIEKNKTIQVLDNILFQGYEKIKLEQEYLAEEKMKINEKIAILDAKANPYKDKKEEYIMIKEGRPIEIDIEERQEKEEFEEKEKIIVHERKFSEPIDTGGSSSEEEFIEGKEEEKKEENKKQLETLFYFLNEWNKYIQEKFGKDFNKMIDINIFFGKTRLRKDYKLKAESFKKIFISYCVIGKKKSEKNKLNKIINNFFEEKIKNKK
ncbi:MAG: hypothetical protein V1910_02100 [bacterium]